MNNFEDHCWNVHVTHHKEYELHGLSITELLEFLDEDVWNRDFCGAFIGRDVDCTGVLRFFFRNDDAVATYEDFEKLEMRCTFDVAACQQPSWDEMVPLTPSDAHDFSFIRCSIVRKDLVMKVVSDYLSTGKLSDLKVIGADGRPANV